MTQQNINSTSMLKVGTILRGTYRIDSYLSSGGFGNTYVATNVEFEERVAIKEFFMKGVTQRDDNQTTVSVSNAENSNSFLEQKEKFKKEARRIRQLKNEHIVSVHDLFEENGTAYYVMDYVDGENLAERLKRTGKPMSEQEVRAILPQILDALKSVHDAGIWHLDLKPANIMLDKSGNVKLIDFGASKQLNAQKGGATTSTAISYTNGYAPREQMEQNYDKFGPWTDIYALGATLYSLLTNKLPPLPTDIDDDISEDKHVALPFPNDVSAEMKLPVLTMLSTNRLQRPQNVEELVDAENTRIIMKEPKTPLLQQTNIDNNGQTRNSDEETIIADVQTDYRKQVEEIRESMPAVGRKKSFSDRLAKNTVWGCGITIGVIFLITIILNFVGFFNNSTSSPNIVERMQYETAIGGCQYSGPVDDQNQPHGKGEAFFNDGRYYKGDFEHGVLTGDNCYFTYTNGDEFKGKFRNNSFYYGTYKIAKDASFFIGSYENGQPKSGYWSDKNGKWIQDL